MQLIILGMHRSGTSALTKIINLMGVHFGPNELALPACSDNPKGFWERKDVLRDSQQLLTLLGCDWDKIADFNLDDIGAHLSDHYRVKTNKIINELNPHRPWIVKDPRLCLLFPLWYDLLDSPICIHIYRNPLEVAQSLKKRNHIPIHVGIALWEKYNLHALNASKAMPRILVSFAELISDPLATAQKLLAQLERCKIRTLSLPSTEDLQDFIDPKLHHHRSSTKSLNSYLNTPQADLFDALETGTVFNFESIPELSHGAKTALSEYEEEREHQKKTAAAHTGLKKKIKKNQKQLQQLKNRRVVKTGLKIAKQAWRTKQFINKSSQLLQKHRPGRRPRLDITICTPKPQGGDSWGDTHFAKCFATSLQEEGYQTTVYYKSEWTKSKNHHADIRLHIRGLNPFPPVPGAVNIMWIICHPEIVSIKECQKYDIILVASEIYAKKLTEQITVPVHVFPQATDHLRFEPTPPDPALKTELLFVGNTRKQYRPFEYRPCVIWASELDTKFHLYGKGWKKYIPDSFIKGEYFPNENLSTLYASADIVLNDHWQDMKEYGIISNRTFDVLASESFLISDYVNGIDEMFKGSVPTYSNRQEFTELIEYFLQNPEKRAALAQKGREIVLAEHTFDIRARKLKNIIADFLKRVEKKLTA